VDPYCADPFDQVVDLVRALNVNSVRLPHATFRRR